MGEVNTIDGPVSRIVIYNSTHLCTAEMLTNLCYKITILRHSGLATVRRSVTLQIYSLVIRPAVVCGG